MSQSILSYVVEKLNADKARWPEIAEESGVSQRTFEKVANGQTASPTWKTLEPLYTLFQREDAAKSRRRKAS